MHHHGTAVLDRTAEATPVSTPGASARDRWLAQCESNLAKALADRNAHLLPLPASLVFCPQPDLCPDCHGTGYSHDDFELCYCMAGEVPAPSDYDFPRFTDTEARSLTSPRAWYPQPWQARVWWKTCPTCNIAPVKTGPYDDHGHVIRVPWEPDCPDCHDTGWTLYTAPIIRPAAVCRCQGTGIVTDDGSITDVIGWPLPCTCVTSVPPQVKALTRRVATARPARSALLSAPLPRSGL